MSKEDCHDPSQMPRWSTVSREGFVYCATGRLTLHEEDVKDDTELKVASEDGDIIILGSWDADNGMYDEDLAAKGVKCFFS